MNTLQRPLNPMPEFVFDALLTNNLMEHYKLRPAYQRNDYIGWITRAKREETKKKRLSQMLNDLRDGKEYMGMVYKAKRP